MRLSSVYLTRLENQQDLPHQARRLWQGGDLFDAVEDTHIPGNLCRLIMGDTPRLYPRLSLSFSLFRPSSSATEEGQGRTGETLL